MKQIKNNSYNELFINGSKFYSYGFQIENENEFKEILNKIKKENKKAVHVCYAYRIKNKNLILQKQFDDGEPKNSAGKRILSVLEENELINSTIIVVRYKSKSMLGLGLLTRCYYNVSDLLVKNNNIQEYNEYLNINIGFDNYKQKNLIINFLKNFKHEIISHNSNYIEVKILKNDYEVIQNLWNFLKKEKNE